MAKRYAPFDPKTAFAEDAVTLTASGVVQEGETDKVLTIGPGRHDMWLVVDVTAMAQKPDVVTGEGEEEVTTPSGPAGGYRFILQGSDAEDFDVSEGEATKVVNLAQFEVGDTAALAAGATDQTEGRYLIPAANEIKQQFEDCKFVRLYVLITATVELEEGEEEEVPESITFKAWLSKEPHA